LYALTKCGWSHFQALIHLQTPEQIRHFAQQVQQHGWTTRQLKRAIEIGGDVEPGFADMPSPPRVSVQGEQDHPDPSQMSNDGVMHQRPAGLR
jgi:hypothetical protein